MKKYLLGSIAIVLAVAFSAFTKPSTHPTTDFYFPLDDTQSSAVPLTYERDTDNNPYTSAQLGCSSSNKFCEAAYTSYTTSGSGPYTYTVTGSIIGGTTTKKP